MTESAAAAVDSRLLAFEDASKWYGPVIGVNQVSLALGPGITGLVGANGAGKSTLLKLATGQLKPDLGSVSVFGVDAWDWRAKDYFGYCPDVDAFYEEMSGAAFVRTIARLCGYKAGEAADLASAALERVGMTGRAGRRIRGYSKGMRQRIKLAAALIHDPPLVVLDEPLSGIDPVGRREFLELFLALAGQNKCLLISSHELEALEKLTDHVAVMARGRMVAVGTLATIRDLFEDMPLSVRIDCPECRQLAARLITWDEVAGLDAGSDSLIVRARNPRQFFRAFTRLVCDEGIAVSHFEPLDDSAHAILGYLLGGIGKT
ncbi:MAG: ABC transporter ATP-binding protein [Gemmataceae bacterium]|nr:ABC transporter ATP-binding protein [Gemmataceae bacterium]